MCPVTLNFLNKLKLKTLELKPCITDLSLFAVDRNMYIIEFKLSDKEMLILHVCTADSDFMMPSDVEQSRTRVTFQWQYHAKDKVYSTMSGKYELCESLFFNHNNEEIYTKLLKPLKLLIE